MNLLSAMLEADVKKIVFSSTAATYGEPEYIPIDEKHPQNPINPYGQSKLMIEKIMDDYDKEAIAMAEKKNPTLKKAREEITYLTGDAAVQRLEEL